MANRNKRKLAALNKKNCEEQTMRKCGQEDRRDTDR